MEVVRTKEALEKALEKLKKFQTKISFIPTMGNLHNGHLKLVEAGKRLAEHTVVSIFVNKKQFSKGEDFESYPRTEEEDLEKLKNIGASLVYIPKTEAEIFGNRFDLKLDVPQLTNCLCGLTRPDFFNGVLSVVLKLFLQIKPDFAVFGKKDFQQFLAVSALAESLDIGIEVIGLEIIREKNGLAMSSRNNYFNDEEREKAGFIYEKLQNAKTRILEEGNILQILEEMKKELILNGIEKIDYLEVRNSKNLDLITKLEAGIKPVLFFAGFLKGVRLIDNVEIC